MEPESKDLPAVGSPADPRAGSLRESLLPPSLETQTASWRRWTVEASAGESQLIGRQVETAVPPVDSEAACLAGRHHRRAAKWRR